MKENYTRMLPWYYVFKVTKTAVISIQNDRTDFWEASSTVFLFPPILERARSTTTYYITDLYPPLAMFHYFIISHICTHGIPLSLLSTVHTPLANLLINFSNILPWYISRKSISCVIQRIDHNDLDNDLLNPIVVSFSKRRRSYEKEETYNKCIISTQE